MGGTETIASPYHWRKLLQPYYEQDKLQLVDLSSYKINAMPAVPGINMGRLTSRLDGYVQEGCQPRFLLQS